MNRQYGTRVKSSLNASIDSFQHIALVCSTAVQKLQKLSGDVDKGRPLSKEDASKITLLLGKLGPLSNFLTELADEYVSLDPPIVEIPWFDAKLNKLDLTYVIGDNPWEFTLTYTCKEKLNEIGKVLNAKYLQQNLKTFVILPREGQFVICREGSNLFRAMILKCFPKGRFRILKIDSNSEGFVKSTNMYQVPKEVASIPCQSLRCCLNKEDQHLQKRWSTELGLLFRKQLTECHLTVDILEVLKAPTPPKCLARMYAYNDDLQEEISLSSWINEKVLVDLRSFSTGAEVMAVLDEAVMDPFYYSRTTLSKTEQDLSLSLNLNDGPGPGYFLKIFKTDVLAADPVPEVVEKKRRTRVTKARNRITKYDVPQLIEPSFSFSNITVPTGSTKMNFLPSCSKQEKPSSKSSKISVDAPEFVPRLRGNEPLSP